MRPRRSVCTQASGVKFSRMSEEEMPHGRAFPASLNDVESVSSNADSEATLRASQDGDERASVLALDKKKARAKRRQREHI